MVKVLSHLTIENYGPFNKLDIDLNDITIFVGRNNTGKTTALEAATLLLSSTNNFKDASDTTIIPTHIKTKGKYLVNVLRDNATIEGTIIRDNEKHDLKIHIALEMNKIDEKIRDLIQNEIIRRITKIPPNSQEILNNVFNRELKKYSDIKEIAKTFEDFINNITTTLSNYYLDILTNATIIITLINNKLTSAILVPADEHYEISTKLLNALVKLGFTRTEAKRFVRNQLGQIFEDIILIQQAGVKPIRVWHGTLSPLSIDRLPALKQTELIDLLRKEVSYFYDYRNNQVVLNFEGNKIEVPFGLMGSGFVALTRLLGLIVMGVDVAIIDEPEQHLHPGFMEKFVQYMLEPRYLSQIQYIMATQSIEFLDYVLTEAHERGSLDKIRLVRLYLMPGGGIDYEQLTGDEAYDERERLKSDLRGP